MRLQTEEIDYLKQQYQNLESRINSGTIGGGNIIERKLENVRREMRNNVDTLQSQIRNTHVNNTSYDSPIKYPSDFSRELKVQ